MNDPAVFHANLQRGILLREQGRIREAIGFVQAAIATDPNAPQGYAELARCWNAIPAERAKCIQAIDRAIGLAPDFSYYFGLKGWFLVCQMRYREAMKAAQQGLAIDPICLQSLNALANAHTKLSQWKKAELACLRILEVYPDDAAGLNLLAQSLRLQGRWKESRAVVAQILAQMPNNAFGHTNAGYGALAAGDHRRANGHFLESLRMEPHSDHARRGLIASLRARIWIIRFNTRITSSLHRPTSLLNLIALPIAVVFFIALSIQGSLFIDRFYVHAGTILFIIIFACLLLYIYLSAIVGLMGNFLLLFDSLGRHALTRQEKAKACVPALFFVFTMIYLCTSGLGWLALGLTVLLALLALSIQYPLMKDRWQRRRESAANDAG